MLGGKYLFKKFVIIIFLNQRSIHEATCYESVVIGLL